eukprot:TRINITY_DN15049_c0_g1_i1.p2 TRINITY_DN15049_c0_g1~~TRINITY_DN15049_c0_g1_i1.p2  ORF type:complete len:189 (+),score=35.35 TRINITY_DN15049_c0_g1_i1:142-708(+)
MYVCVLQTKSEDDLYKILGINRDADQRTIKKAFNKLSRKYHPDKNKEPDAAEYYSKIINAYEVLSDDDKKQQYDKYGTVNPNQQQPDSPFRQQGGQNGNGYYYFYQDGQGNSYQYYSTNQQKRGYGDFGGFDDLFEQIEKEQMRQNQKRQQQQQQQRRYRKIIRGNNGYFYVQDESDEENNGLSLIHI